MHQIYIDEGSFNFIYQIPQILYSSLISNVIYIIIKTLSLSEKNVLEIKKEKNIDNLDNKSKDILKCLYIKIQLFFTFSFILLLFFWYYISCFCAVYKNTQLHLIKNVSITLTLSLLYPFGIYLIPGALRIASLRRNKNNRECLYKFSLILQLI